MSSIYDYIYVFLETYIFSDNYTGYLINTAYVVGRDINGFDAILTLQDILCTTTTIIIMIIGVVLLCLLVRWVFKTVVNAFAFRR